MGLKSNQDIMHGRARSSLFAFGCGMLMSCGSYGHANADESTGLPFFSKPYPFFYAYTERPPRPCWITHETPGLFGPTYTREWVCDEVIKSRY